MRKILIGMVLAGVLGVGGLVWYKSRPEPELETRFVEPVRQKQNEAEKKTDEEVLGASNVELTEPGNYVKLENPYHVFQSFNNCGPATLAMALNFWGENKTQEELGELMRPYQIPSGDNDDKTVFLSEFVDWAEKFGYKAVNRPNGDIKLLQKLTANGIPVVVKTWLHPGEDIGHFRLVLGYDEADQVILQDDSYEGKNKRISYWDFMNMWQAFNYSYVVVYPSEKSEVVETILGAELDEQTAWENTLSRAKEEEQLDSDNIYPLFNQLVADYYLGDYQKAVEIYEKVEDKLPRRMMWYQIEPVRAYFELGNYSRVFELTNNILENGNRAFSELYLIRAEVYKKQGNEAAANQELELARKYNENLEI